MLDLMREIAEQLKILSSAGNNNESWCNDGLCAQRLGKDPFLSKLLGSLKLELSRGASLAQLYAFKELD
jgi:hypothetical protein